MAKVIKITPEVIEEMKNDFEQAIKDAKLSDGKFTYSKVVGEIDRHAEVIFTEKAWLKMNMLITSFDKEIAWHGVAERGENPDEYIISDILVYPQEVTGTTVTTDQEKYEMWLYEQEDDVFNNIRMQGHSHVNMGVTPSGVDTSLYERLLDQLDDTMFYIFLIFNKRGDEMYKIYDLRENVLFETKDVTASVIEDTIGLSDFMEEAKDMVKTKTYYGAGSTWKNGNTQPPATTGSKVPVSTSNDKVGKKKGREKKKNSGSSGYRPPSVYGYDDDDYGDFIGGYGGYGYGRRY